MGVVEKKFFDQASFMKRVEQRRADLKIQKQEVGAYVGLDGVAYSEWKSGARGMTLDIAIGVCQKLKIRPAWALFEEGPMTDQEAKALGDVRAFIAAATPVPAASAQPASPSNKSDPLQLTVEEMETFLKFAGTQVKTMKRELPLTIALRKIAMKLDRDAVQSERRQVQGKAAASAPNVERSAPSEATLELPSVRRIDRPS